MPVLAQHGYGAGSKIQTALENGYIDGCIFSPKDIAQDKLISAIGDVKQTKKNAAVYFDPQYYATTIAQEPNAKLGYLASDYTNYFSSKTLGELRREKNVSSEAEKVIRFQKETLNLSNIIAPNILIQDGLNSASSSISKNFLEICAEKANEASVGGQALLTLALDQSCFRRSQDLLDLVDEITGMNLDVQGRRPESLVHAGNTCRANVPGIRALAKRLRNRLRVFIPARPLSLGGRGQFHRMRMV